MTAGAWVWVVTYARAGSDCGSDTAGVWTVTRTKAEAVASMRAAARELRAEGYRVDTSGGCGDVADWVYAVEHWPVLGARAVVRS